MSDLQEHEHLDRTLKLWGFGAALAWLILLGAHAYGAYSSLPDGAVIGGFALLLYASALLVPLVLIAAILQILGLLKRLRAEAQHLLALKNYTPQEPKEDVAKTMQSIRAEMRSDITRLISKQNKTELSLAHMTEAIGQLRHSPQPAPAATNVPASPTRQNTRQSDLPLGTHRAAAVPLGWQDRLTALNFPKDQNDRAGFAALARAMKDRTLGQVLRAAEDALNLLSQDGIYVDDLPNPVEDAMLWRRLASGERGASLAPIAAVDAPEAIEKVQNRMRTDAVVRDTGLHFLRHFDMFLRELAGSADDHSLSKLGKTRTARAFLLYATVTGAFE